MGLSGPGYWAGRGSEPSNIINLRRAGSRNGFGHGTAKPVIDLQFQASDSRLAKPPTTIRVLQIKIVSWGRGPSVVYEEHTLDQVCQAVEAAWQGGRAIVLSGGGCPAGQTVAR